MSQATDRIQIYDTTLRDGTQGEGVSLTGHDKLLIARRLDDLGVDYIEGGYPLSNPKDAAFFDEIRKADLKTAKIAAFGMTRRKGVSAERDDGMRALLASEAPVVTLVGKTWDLHVRDVLRVGEAENLAMIADSVALMVRSGRECIFDAEHFFDGWRANAEHALAALTAAHEAGAACLVLCDTNGGSTMSQIRQAVCAVRDALGAAELGIHCHNDANLAVANSLVAVECGVRHVQGTINGIGERCGNADLISLIANLSLKYGRAVLRPDSIKRLTETSRFVYEMANMNLQANQPFVGLAAFAHKGGMHVHAVQRNVSTYEHIDPAEVGNRRRILISELSGLSNISATVGAKFGIADDKETQRKILEEVMRRENDGYQFEAAEASFEILIRKLLGGDWYRPLWELDHYRCVIFQHTGADIDTEAIVKLTVGGEVRHTVAEGDGPVDSLYNSLCDALRPHYPGVDDLHLVDYRVRVVKTQAETAAKVRVVIDWRDTSDETYFGSVGVSENIIQASWQALTDAIEYKLLKDPT